MSYRKYAGDYSLENVTDKNGKLKTVPVYKGPRYILTVDSAALAAAKPQIIGSVVVFWLAQIAALSLNTRCARCMWVVMPQAFALLAFGFLTVGAWMLIRAEQPMIREYAEHMHNRYSGGASIAMFLNGAAFIGAILASALYRNELMLPADIFYLTLLALAQAACVIAFLKRNCAEVCIVSDQG